MKPFHNFEDFLLFAALGMLAVIALLAFEVPSCNDRREFRERCEAVCIPNQSKVILEECNCRIPSGWEKREIGAVEVQGGIEQYKVEKPN